MDRLSSNRLRKGLSQCSHRKRRLLVVLVRKIIGVVDDSDQKRTAWAPSNILAILKLLLGDLEPVAARTRIKVDILVLVVLKVLFV